MTKSVLKPEIISYLSTKLNKKEGTIRALISSIRRTHPNVTINAAAHLLATQNRLSVMQKLSSTDKLSLKDTSINNHVPQRSQAKSRVVSPKRVIRVVKINGVPQFSDPLLNPTKLQEAREMAELYPLLYLLENSLRALIIKVYSEKSGANWWDTLHPKLRNDDKLKKRKEKEESNSWHQRRGSHNIDYLDFDELRGFISQKPEWFKPYFTERWFSEFMDEVYSSRCVVCHMNPLDTNNVMALKVRFNQWNKILNKHFDKQNETAGTKV